jgi:Tol biopolymer transport system component
MGKHLPAEITDLGPVKKEYKGNVLWIFGPTGSIAIVMLLIVGILICKSAFDSLLNQGLNSILVSPSDFVCGPLAVVGSAAGLLMMLIGLTDRVVVCRDGFAFLSRIPREVDVWRWGDIESVTYRSMEDKGHTIHTYTVRGKDNKRIELDSLEHIQDLGHTIEEEVTKVKRSGESQNETRVIESDRTKSRTVPEHQANEKLLAVFDIYRFTQEQLSQVKVSPDNKHIAYVDYIGENSWVTLDQQVGETFRSISKDSLTFSPDSSRFAYVGCDEQRKHLVVDGVKYGPYTDFIDCSPQFSPDSQRIAYATRELYKVRIHMDEAEVFKADLVGDVLVFSPNSQSFAFRVGIGEKQCIVVDGKQGPLYDQVDNPHFSPNNQCMAYAARKGERWFIVVNGEQGPEFKDAAGPVFSPDSEHIAYYAQAHDGRYLVIDDKLMGPHFTFGQSPFGMFRFSPDSQKIAYVVQEANIFLFLRYGHTEHVVVDGRHCKSYRRCGSLIFSPNSQQLGYLAYTDGEYYVIINEESFGPYQDIRDDSPVFSPDSKLCAFSAYDLGVSTVYVNGEALDSYQLAYSPVFGPDSKHFAYGAYNADDCQVVIDDIPGKRYKELMCRDQACVKFDSPHELHYIASGKEAPDHWFLVTETF